MKRARGVEQALTQEPEPIVTSTPNDPEPTITRQELFQTLRELFIPLREIQQLKNEQLRQRLGENNDGNNFVTSINGFSPPTTFQQRMGDYILTQLYAKFQNSNNH